MRNLWGGLSPWGMTWETSGYEGLEPALGGWGQLEQQNGDW